MKLIRRDNITPWNTGGWLYYYGVYKPNRGRPNLVFLQMFMDPASLGILSTRKSSYPSFSSFHLPLTLLHPSHNTILPYSVPLEVLHLHGFTSTPYIALKILFLERLFSSVDSSNYTVKVGTICVHQSLWASNSQCPWEKLFNEVIATGSHCDTKRF